LKRISVKIAGFFSAFFEPCFFAEQRARFREKTKGFTAHLHQGTQVPPCRNRTKLAQISVEKKAFHSFGHGNSRCKHVWKEPFVFHL